MKVTIYQQLCTDEKNGTKKIINEASLFFYYDFSDNTVWIDDNAEDLEEILGAEQDF